jgi:hypothetical protein
MPFANKHLTSVALSTWLRVLEQRHSRTVCDCSISGPVGVLRHVDDQQVYWAIVRSLVRESYAPGT